MNDKNFSIKEFYDKHQVWLHCILVLIASIVLGWISVLFMDYWTNHGKSEIVPSVVGLDYIEATSILESKDFEVEIDSIYDKEAKYGQVLAQSPNGAEEVKYGRTIYLKINSTSPEVVQIVEELTHIASMQAQNMLTALGFTNIKVKEVLGANDDEVIEVRSNGRQVEMGDKLPVTAEIELTVTYAPNEKMYIDTLSVEDANLLLNDTLQLEAII